MALSSTQTASNVAPAGVTDRPPRGITWGPQLAAPQPKVFSSVDTIHYGLHVKWNEAPALFDALDEGKALAQEKDIEVPFRFGSCDANIYPTGRRGGFRWHLSFADIDVFFSIRNHESNTPNVWVEIGSVSCWSYGFESAIEQVQQYIRDLYGVVVDSSVSRVDLAADYIGYGFADTGIIDHQRWVKRAVNFSLHGSGSKFSGISVGMSGALALRIYDKTLELSNRPAKKEFFYSFWDLDQEDTETEVTRVEFQCRRVVLRELGIRDLKSLQKKFKGIWHYCTHKWFRFSSTAVDRKNRHQDTSELDPWWVSVQSVKWSGVLAERRAIVPHGNIEQLLKQAAGCLMKVSAIKECGLACDVEDSLIKVCDEMKTSLSAFLEKMRSDTLDFSTRYHRKLSDVWAFKNHAAIGAS